MKSPRDTSALIQRLASDATRTRRRQRLRFELILPIAACCSLVLSIVLALVLFGIRQDVVAPLLSTPFLFKFVTMLMLALAGLVLVRQAGMPASGSLGWTALIPGLLLLAAGILVDRSGFPLSGHNRGSVPICVSAIVLLSLPALAVALATLKRGVPVNPARAGLSAGFFAGAIGGASYAIACKNDGTLFVAVWYGLAIVIVSALGALIGRKMLRW